METRDKGRPYNAPGLSNAEGWGAKAKGGFGGDIYHVTNLNDDGSAGCFRNGLDTADGPRTIVFDVGGKITLLSKLILNKSFITIDGLTAPTPGITFVDYEFLVQDAEHVILRYLRSRVGDTEGSHDADAFQIVGSTNILFDHLSASWAIDENIGIFESDLITVQWGIISEGLHNAHHEKGPHSMGLLSQHGRTTVHHCLFAHNNERNPRVQRQCDVVNNIIYNFSNIGTDVAEPEPETNVNVENNYWIHGPSSPNPAFKLYFRGRLDARFYPSSGNRIDDNLNGTLDGVEPTTYEIVGVPIQYDKRFHHPKVTTTSAAQAYIDVLADAGCSNFPDATDLRILDDVVNETGGIIDSQTEVPEWPI